MNTNVKLDNEKECATTEIHALSHDGRGIATIHNKTTFINGALPQEKITYHITQRRSQYNEAEMNTLIHTSPDRVIPPCQHFGVCGGCSLQHMNMETQLAFKQQTLLDQLKHFGQITPETILPPLTATELGYRRKARLGVKFVIKKNKLLVGFREKASNYLADLEHCLVLHPKIGMHLNDLSQLIASLLCYRHIPQIEVAVGDDEAALVFRHLEPLAETDKQKLIEYGKAHHIHIYLQPNPPAKIAKLWPENYPDQLHYSLPDYQLNFLFHPLDFTQINLEMNRLMIKHALDLLDLKKEDNVLDLFCGIGNFTLPIARHVNHVTGIEGSMDMINRASNNALHNNIHNVDFHVANLTESLGSAAWTKRTYNKILLDPPRTGAKEILTYFTQLNAQQIVYVSCNPATLARDAGELVHQHGYTLKRTGIMNMFPHTSHIEAIALFTR